MDKFKAKIITDRKTPPVSHFFPKGTIVTVEEQVGRAMYIATATIDTPNQTGLFTRQIIDETDFERVDGPVVEAAVEFVKTNANSMPLADIVDALAEMGYIRPQIQDAIRQVLETL